MAGDWIKVEKATLRKPEILRIAAILEIHPDHAFGLCVRFWCWCDDQLQTANVRGVSEMLVDALVERKGFAAALLEVGWLQARNGSLVIPNFDRHLSKSAKKRGLTARRVAKHSHKKTNDPSVSSALAREEKRRDKRKINKKKTEFVPPTEAEVAAFCLERQNGIDPVAFVAHYSANGWVQGRGKPIRDWKSAVITWERNRNQGNRPQKQRLMTPDEEKEWQPT